MFNGILSTESFCSYSKQTGRFPVRSSQGNLYMYVLYNYDTKTLHVIAIPNCQAATIWDSWLKTYNTLLSKVYQIQHHILDNEWSKDLKATFSKHNIDYQLVPPAEHQVNAAECAILTFKNHFIAILSMVDFNFTLAEWDRLLPLAVITLNLLCSSHLHPSLLTHASLFGSFGYNHQEQKW